MDYTPIANLPWPQLGDPPNIETSIKPLADALDSLVIPRFASVSLRDAAITTPVSGQYVHVTSHGFQKYDGTQWVTVFGPGVPDCRAYATAVTNMTSGTSTIITLGGEAWDTTGTMHSTTTNTSRITVPYSGLYRVTAHLTFTANANGYREVMVRKNGSSAEAYIRLSPLGIAIAHYSFSEEIALQGGDYLEMIGTQDSGSTLTNATGDRNTFLHVRRVGDSPTG